MSIRLVAVDLDGTLLNSEKEITARTVNAIARARHVGVHLVMASARPPRSVQPLYDQLQLRTLQINHNGAMVWDPINRKALLHRPLTVATCRAVIDKARQKYPEILISLEVMDRHYTDYFDESYVTERGRHRQPDKVGSIDELLTEPVTKLLLLGPPAKILELRGLLSSHFGGQLSIARSEEYMLQVMHPTAGKSSALATVCKYYQLTRDEVMAIGDMPNDLGMIQWAGMGVAVHNAHPLVRQAADYITASNDDDGVAEALEMFVVGR